VRLAPLLIGVCFLDELGSGIPFVGAPEIKDGFGVSYAMAAGWLLFAITIAGTVLEPPLFLLADRFSKKRFVCGGLAALGLVCIGAGLAPGYALLVAALVLYGPLSGCGVALAQAALADAKPDDVERMLVRWTFSGTLGDLLVPSLVALAAIFTVGWRGAFVAVGVVMIGYALLLSRQRFPEPVAHAHGEDEPGLGAAFAAALRNPGLVRWAVAVALCALMDEILIAFTALYMADVLQLDLGARTAALTACELGVIVGLMGSDALLARVAPRALLLASAAACALAWLAFLSVENAFAASLALFATGAFAATHYPLVKAQAYRALPGRSGTVNAVLTLFGVSELVVPVLLGLAADRLGLRFTLVLLALQPLGILALALGARPLRAGTAAE
jgi:predicted MFS family arabinose efflux permease